MAATPVQAAEPSAPPGEQRSDTTKPAFRLDGALGFSRFEQQVKSEVGGARGERLVENSELGLGLIGTYRFFEPFSAGLYARFDVGSRQAGRFESFFTPLVGVAWLVGPEPEAAD